MAQSQRTLNEIRAQRRAKLDELREGGVNPYPYRFEVTHRSGDLQSLDDAEFPDDAAIAGRVVSIRRMGKASFAHLQDAEGRQQIYIKRDIVSENVYDDLFGRIDLGDFLATHGRVFRTRTGEITVEAQDVTLLAKSLRPLPNLKEKDGEVFDPFEDKENRYRRRYLDLIANPEVKDVFIKRAAIIKSLRDGLDKEGYVEVETPALQPLYGGASARPFTTHHNSLDQTLYLRIADELYLKRLIIGGFERVYELAKDFRNEGMDRSHNPEFTMLEFYEAYADYNRMMELTESLVRGVAESSSTVKVTFQGHDIDLTKPFGKDSYWNLLNHHAGTDVSKFTEADQLYTLANDKGHSLPPDLNFGQLLDKLFGMIVEPHLVAPVFVIDHPKAISPLAKTHRGGDESLVERFELYIAGMEFANAFTELNDPLDQRQRLEAQDGLRSEGDEEAQSLDEDFLEAMEFGMPPTGGVGLGVDRLVMLLTGQDSIKDVILFPAMRPNPS